MESMNLQTEPDKSKNNEANNKIANPQPAHKLLSSIANLNMLENDNARHKQIWIHDRQWQRRDDDNNKNSNNTKYKDWDHQH